MRRKQVDNLRTLRFNSIWLVPILALIVAGWMVYENWAEQGEQITLVAKSAEGIEAGKTKVKVHNVEVGEVKDVRLSENFKKALITVQMKQDTEGMLRSDANFWVVKPRVGIKGISGLGTMLSGAYIEMEPGREGESMERFQMMSQPPLSTTEDRGIRLRLLSKDQAKLDVGAPVHFRGYEVGHIEKVDFNMETGAINYRVFIQAPYDSFINDAVQFWLTPGFSVKGSARGIEVRMDSLETLFVGGISFGLPKNRKPGDPVTDLTEFRLYESREVALDNQYSESIEYVFLFRDSVSGLKEGAPVEFCGVRIGTVQEVPFTSSDGGQETVLQRKRIPVLASIEPQRMDPRIPDSSPDYWQNYFKKRISHGLRASLKTSNYITGAQVIDLAYRGKSRSVKTHKWNDHLVFPTVPKDGIEDIKTQINALLAKLNGLPLEGTVTNLNATIESSKETFAEMAKLSRSIRKVAEDPATRKLPNKINATMEQLNATLAGYKIKSPLGQNLQRNLRALERILNELHPFIREMREQPNMLIFKRRRLPDPIPQKGKKEKK